MVVMDGGMDGGIEYIYGQGHPQSILTNRILEKTPFNTYLFSLLRISWAGTTFVISLIFI